eukprot:gb/GEZN01008260.1/.p1 GENE.gb/GEZN01008260.1/~~gb/GEZN01008260.1/.p1  ORF type:complete len:470 (-),score=8.88 gb/GEZN01008260.1/:40-1392(-)
MCMLIASIFCSAALEKLSDPVLATRFDTAKFFGFFFITWMLPMTILSRWDWSIEDLSDNSYASQSDAYVYGIFPLTVAFGCWVPWLFTMLTLDNQQTDRELLKSYVPTPESTSMGPDGEVIKVPASRVPLAPPRPRREKVVFAIFFVLAYGLGIFVPWIFRKYFPVPFNLISIGWSSSALLALLIIPFLERPARHWQNYRHDIFPRFGVFYVIVWFSTAGVARVLIDEFYTTRYVYGGFDDAALWFMSPCLILLKNSQLWFNSRVLPSSLLTSASFFAIHAASSIILSGIYSNFKFPMELYCWTLSLQLVEQVLFFMWLCKASPLKIQRHESILAAYLIGSCVQIGTPLMWLVFTIFSVRGKNATMFPGVELTSEGVVDEIMVRLLWAAFTHLALLAPVLTLPTISWSQLLTVNKRSAWQSLIHSVYVMLPIFFALSAYGGCVLCFVAHS